MFSLHHYTDWRVNMKCRTRRWNLGSWSHYCWTRALLAALRYPLPTDGIFPHLAHSHTCVTAQVWPMSQFFLLTLQKNKTLLWCFTLVKFSTKFYQTLFQTPQSFGHYFLETWKLCKEGIGGILVKLYPYFHFATFKWTAEPSSLSGNEYSFAF